MKTKLDKDVMPSGPSDIHWLPAKNQVAKKAEWTLREMTVLEEKRAENMSYREIGKLIGRTELACSRRAKLMGLETRKQPDWLVEEDEIIRLYRPAGASITLRALTKNGFKRTERAVTSRTIQLTGIGFESWDFVKDLSVDDFHSALVAIYRELRGGKLTNATLATETRLSHTRINKLFASGSAREPLSDVTRHHLWLLVFRWKYEFSTELYKFGGGVV